MATSNLYVFGSSPLDTLLRTSLQLCGFVPSEVEGWKAEAAQFSLNLILSDWANRGDNLWLSQTLMHSIIPNQTTYLLPPQVTTIKELTAVQLQNAGSGTPISDFTQANFTWKGLDYGAGAQVAVSYAGIQPLFADHFTLDLQYAFDSPGFDPETETWTSAFAQPWTPSPQQVVPGQLTWMVPTAPVGARAWRFLNTSALGNFAASTISFSQQTNSLLLAALSENDYYSISRQNPQQQPTSPSSYYLDRQIQPTMNLWPVPNQTYTAFVYKAMTTPQDVGTLINQQQVPQRFLRALVYELAAELALQFAPPLFPMLNQQATMLHDRAAGEDRERVPLRITPNFMSYT